MILETMFFSVAAGATLAVLFAGYSPEQRRKVGEGERGKAAARHPRPRKAAAQEEPSPSMQGEFETSGDVGAPAPPESMQPTVNETCPVDGRHIDAGVPKRVHHGEFLGFCSRECVGKWDGFDEMTKLDRLEEVDIVNE